MSIRTYSRSDVVTADTSTLELRHLPDHRDEPSEPGASLRPSPADLRDFLEHRVANRLFGRLAAVGSVLTTALALAVGWYLNRELKDKVDDRVENRLKDTLPEKLSHLLVQGTEFERRVQDKVKKEIESDRTTEAIKHQLLPMLTNQTVEFAAKSYRDQITNRDIPVSERARLLAAYPVYPEAPEVFSDFVLKLLDDDNARIRQQALGAIGRRPIGQANVARLLIALEKERPTNSSSGASSQHSLFEEFPAEVIESLAMAGVGALPELDRWLKEKREPKRVQLVAWALGRIGGRNSLAILLRLATSEDRQVRPYGYEGIINLDADELTRADRRRAIEELWKSLRDRPGDPARPKTPVEWTTVESTLGDAHYILRRFDGTFADTGKEKYSHVLRYVKDDVMPLRSQLNSSELEAIQRLLASAAPAEWDDLRDGFWPGRGLSGTPGDDVRVAALKVLVPMLGDTIWLPNPVLFQRPSGTGKRDWQPTKERKERVASEIAAELIKLDQCLVRPEYYSALTIALRLCDAGTLHNCLDRFPGLLKAVSKDHWRGWSSDPSPQALAILRVAVARAPEVGPSGLNLLMRECVSGGMVTPRDRLLGELLTRSISPRVKAGDAAALDFLSECLKNLKARRERWDIALNALHALAAVPREQVGDATDRMLALAGQLGGFDERSHKDGFHLLHDHLMLLTQTLSTLGWRDPGTVLQKVRDRLKQLQVIPEKARRDELTEVRCHLIGVLALCGDVAAIPSIADELRLAQRKEDLQNVRRALSELSGLLDLAPPDGYLESNDELQSSAARDGLCTRWQVWWKTNQVEEKIRRSAKEYWDKQAASYSRSPRGTVTPDSLLSDRDIDETCLNGFAHTPVIIAPLNVGPVPVISTDAEQDE